MTALAMLLPGVPFTAALAGLLLPPGRRAAAAYLATGGAAAALLLAVILAAGLDTPEQSFWELVSFGELTVEYGVRLDPAAALVAVAVGVVALAVQVYSVSYLAGDDRYAPYAAQVSLFTAAMLLVVVAGDLIVLLVGWEVMGICSYLLIAHDRRLPEAPGAAVKAFLVTRVGDVGFWLGIILLGVHAGSFRIGAVLAAVPDLPPGLLTAAGLLLLAGVAGKSAQFPLHTWLPDAMAGPTPISALIHAATMVAAGVYVVFRLYPVFDASSSVLAVLGVVAAVTMLLGALAATAADDIKRVLAWSTVSQLAYMTGALAVGATSAAVFHLLTHAAFKALLFLGAGAVIHAVGSNAMAAMGGLRRGMPRTFWSMTIGLAALVGLPPLAGFWSKEAILSAATGADGWVAALVLASGVATVAVTGWYATRLWLRTFFGPPASRTDAPGRAAHDPPPLMAWPVMLLAVPSALLGFAALSSGFADRLAGTRPVDPADPHATESLWHASAFVAVPLAAIALGAGAAWAIWRRDPGADPAAALGPARTVFARGFYLDDVQDAVVVRPVQALARAVRRGDQTVVDGAVEGAGRGTLGFGRLVAAGHRSGLPRAAAGVLAGALIVGLAAALLGGAW